MLSRLCAAHAALMNNDKGVTAIEYGLIAGLIAVIIIGSVKVLGTDLKATFDAVGTALTGG